MRNEPIDFIGIDYAVDNRIAEDVILPLALERRIGFWYTCRSAGAGCGPASAAAPYRTGRRNSTHNSWAQLMLKFVVAHPAVTVATPGTSDPEHMVDNLAGGRGRLPDAQHLARMIEVVERLPNA